MQPNILGIGNVVNNMSTGNNYSHSFGHGCQVHTLQWMLKQKDMDISLSIHNLVMHSCAIEKHWKLGTVEGFGDPEDGLSPKSTTEYLGKY